MREVELNFSGSKMRFPMRSEGQGNMNRRYFKLVSQKPSKTGPALNKGFAVFRALDGTGAFFLLGRQAIEITGFNRLCLKHDPGKAKKMKIIRFKPGDLRAEIQIMGQ
jgi:hypothetical protein